MTYMDTPLLNIKSLLISNIQKHQSYINWHAAVEEAGKSGNLEDGKKFLLMNL